MPKANSSLLIVDAASAFPPPEIDSVTPNQLNLDATEDITITGSWFTANTTVAIAGQTVNSVRVINSVTLEVNVTAGSEVGLFDLVVATTEGGSVTQVDGLEVIGLSCVPTSLTRVGTYVRISGNSATSIGPSTWSNTAFYGGPSIRQAGESVQFQISAARAIAGVTYGNPPRGRFFDIAFGVFTVNNTQLTWAQGSRKGRSDSYVDWSPSQKIRLTITASLQVECQIEDNPGGGVFTPFYTFSNTVVAQLAPYGALGDTGATVTDFKVCK